MIESMLIGFCTILTIKNILLIVIGVIIGIIFGSIPGLNATMAIALFLPLTFGMEASNGFALLIALYVGGISGGLISAILIKIPGTPSSIASTFDGGPMADKGEGGRALAIGIIASGLGTIISFIFLLFLSEPIARFSLKFGPYEYFSVIVFALAMVSTLSGESLIRGLTACVLGIFFAMVGASSVDGVLRYTFGLSSLEGGFALVPVMVGMFAVSEILSQVSNMENMNNTSKAKFSVKNLLIYVTELKAQFVNVIRSSLIGLGIGILPGIGGGTSNLVSYSVAKTQSKHSDKFGTGIPDGIVASETANNASIGGALVPLFTLGIPGDTVTAILLGALTVHGLTPGPLLFKQQSTLVYGIFFCLFIATILMMVIELGGLGIFIRILNIPKKILYPIIMVLSVVGAFGINYRIFDIVTILVFGCIGFLMNGAKLPTAPFILGFILGPQAEKYFVRGLMTSQGKAIDFIARPISGVFLVLAIIVFIIGMRQQRKQANNY